MTYKKICGIYEIRNLLNEKVYIGSSYNIKARWNQHKQELSKNVHVNKHLQNAWNKYGEEKFEFKIIEYIEIIDSFENMKDIIIQREQYWIDKTNCCNRKYGYNIAEKAYSKLGVKDSEETKRKKSLAMSTPERKAVSTNNLLKTREKLYKEFGNSFNITRAILTEEQVKEINEKINQNINDYEISKQYNVQPDTISAIRLGKSWTHITKRKLHEAKYTKLTEELVLIVVELLKDKDDVKEISKKLNITEDQVRNIRNGKTWTRLTNKNREDHRVRQPIYQVDENNNIIAEYKSIKEASDTLNIDNSCIGKCCRGERKQVKGYRFIYKN